MQLDVESLRTFTTVLDLGGMTRAAEALDISQSAVSWKIKRLEEKVGRDLLIRDGRTLRPSRDGRELLDYARTIVATHDEAVSRLESSELTGTVKLGTTEEISAARMCDVLARFNRIHPGAMIEFVVDGVESARRDAAARRARRCGASDPSRRVPPVPTPFFGAILSSGCVRPTGPTRPGQCR